MKYFTNNMKKQIRELLFEYGDIEKTKFGFEIEWNESKTCISLIIPLKFPYDIKLAISAQNHKNKLLWFRNSLNCNKKYEVQLLFNEVYKDNKLTKSKYKKIIDSIDLDSPISRLDPIYLELLVYSQSFEKSNLKKYTGSLFGSKELKKFLNENKEFYIIRNNISQSRQPMALVNKNNEYINIFYKDYIKLFHELKDCEVTNQLDNLSL